MRHLVLAAAALLATPAPAAVLYSNNFDTENSGRSARNYTGLDSFTVVDGGFDLVETGDGNGVICRGGGGGCLDLVGTAIGAGLAFSDTFGFGAGDLVTLRYWISGTQRSGTDGYGLGFVFDQLTSGTYIFTDGRGVTSTSSFSTFDLVVQNAGVPAAQEFRNATLSFRAADAGTFSLVIDGLSPSETDAVNDDFGLVLDDLSLELSPVPEPATWGMMLAGFALMGTTLRRRGLAAGHSRWSAFSPL